MRVRSYQDRTLRNLPCKRIQADEIWSFVYAKQKNVPEEKRGQFGYGDVWTWTAIDADTKLIRLLVCRTRDADAACEFMTDLASRLSESRPANDRRPHSLSGCAVDARVWYVRSTTPCW